MLKDQNKPAPPGQTALRFINQAGQTGPVDIYLIPSGQKITDVTPVITRSSFGGNTGYLNIPAGIYTLVAEPSGAVPSNTVDAAYAGAQISYGSGSASTIILIDHRRSAETDLQVIIARDYTPASASDASEPLR